MPTKTRTVETANSVWTTYVGIEARLRDGGLGTEGSIRGRGKDFSYLNDDHNSHEKDPVS
jgi:hypothetical protein